MTKPKTQIGDEVRSMTDAEFAQYQEDQIQEENRQQQIATKALEKAAIIAKLGLTENELKTLLS